MMRVSLFLVLALSGCASQISTQARMSVVGMPVTDLAGCAGKPDKIWRVDATDWILQFEQSTPVQAPVTLKTSFPFSAETDFGARGTCHAVFRIHSGYVASLHFTGPSLTLEGPNAACAPMIKECVTRRDHTTLPDGYDLKDWKP